jgi:arylsulfatase A
VAGEANRRMADFLAEKAVGFIQARQKEPFLLQVSHQAVHIPLSTTPALLEKYKAKKPAVGYPSRPEYAGLLEELDQCVGRIVAEVDRLGLGERTLILFLSDNGGLEHEQGGRIVTSNAPLRGEKGTLYEGGIRIPAIARWTGRVAAGKVCETPAITMDVYPTLLELARAAAPEKQPLDGANLVPLLNDPAASVRREALYWHLPHYHHSTPASAIREGNWKLIEFFETGERQLYNLAADPGETKNLAPQEADRVGKLQASLQAWRTRVGARMPKPNPAYDPARATQLGKGREKKE